jgi:ribonuclease-3
LLGARVAEELFTMYPDIPESKLTLAKIYLVKECTLADIARQIGLGEHIRLGNGERRSGGEEKDAVLSDTLEALLAYLYLVHGREAIASFIKKHIMSQLKDLTQLP